MDLNNIVGFKAVDKNGNERQVTVDEMTELVSARIVSAASEISTFAAATAAGTDEFEDQLPQSDTFSWLRTLDGSKNPTLTSSSAAAKVLGGLLQVSSVGEIDLKPNINVSMKLREGIYAFYDNYAISGFILTVSDNIYTDRSKIIAGEKSVSLSIEFGSNGVTFQSNVGRKLHYRLLAYYK